MNNRINNIFVFSILNYFDKALTFLIPFLVLKEFGENIYSSLEYLISITLIASSFLPLGLNVYLFYDYRKQEDYHSCCIRRESVFNCLFTIYGLIIFILFLLTKFNGFILFCCVRSFYLAYITLLSAKMRIEDKPLNPLIISSCISLFIVILILLFGILKVEYNLFFYSLPYILICCIIWMKGIVSLCSKYNTELNQSFITLFQGIKYGYPLLFTNGLVAVQNNFVKIYGYNILDTQEYSQLSIMLRCFSIVFLAYVAAGAFYQKKLYSKHEIGFMPKIYVKYQTAVICGFILMWLFMFTSNKFGILPYITIGIDFWIICFTYLIMFTRTYLEAFFGKNNKLNLLLCSIGGAFIFFCVGLFLLKVTTQLNLTNLLLLLFFVELIDFDILFILYLTKIKPLEASQMHID